MIHDLYFIGLLARAFGASERLQALTEALGEVQRLGQLEPYRQGFRQYQAFLREAYFTQVPTVRLERAGQVIAEVIPARATQEVRIPNIMPGDYAIRLSTGRLVWTGRLQATDLIWADAFPSAALPLAADTGEGEAVCTKKLELLHREIVVCLYPGVESGMIGIRIERWKRT